MKGRKPKYSMACILMSIFLIIVFTVLGAINRTSQYNILICLVSFVLMCSILYYYYYDDISEMINIIIIAVFCTAFVLFTGNIIKIIDTYYKIGSEAWVNFSGCYFGGAITVIGTIIVLKKGETENDEYLKKMVVMILYSEIVENFNLFKRAVSNQEYLDKKFDTASWDKVKIELIKMNDLRMVSSLIFLYFDLDSVNSKFDQSGTGVVSIDDKDKVQKHFDEVFGQIKELEFVE